MQQPGKFEHRTSLEMDSKQWIEEIFQTSFVFTSERAASTPAVAVAARTLDGGLSMLLPSV